MAALAYPLPVTTIAEMLGVRPRDMDRFEQWSHALALSVDPLLVRDQIQLIKSAAEQVYEYFESIIDERRRAPLLTARQIDSKEPPRYTAQHRVGPLPGGFLFPEWVALFIGIRTISGSVGKDRTQTA